MLKEDLYRFRDLIDQYYADKGRYPASLQALVEDGYLRQIPADPMTRPGDWSGARRAGAGHPGRARHLRRQERVGRRLAERHALQRMVKKRRLVVMAVGGLAAIVAGLAAPSRGATLADRSWPGRLATARPRSGRVPRIGLDRLQGPPENVPVGERDIFDFGAPPPTPEPPPTQPPEPMLPEPDAAPDADAAASAGRQVHGSVESAGGVKVALFVTEKKEVLAGQVGETVMNRFRV